MGLFKLQFFLWLLISVSLSVGSALPSLAQNPVGSRDSSQKNAGLPSDSVGNKTNPKPSRPFLSNDSIQSLRNIKEDSLRKTSSLTDTSKTKIAPPAKKEAWGYFGHDIAGGFQENEINIEEGEIINNILRLVNGRKSKIKFRIDVVIPGQWKSLSKKNRTYEIEPGDSVYIPVMMLPNAMVGNANYLINAFVLSEDDEHLANLYFMVSQKIISKWEITTYPAKLIYFPLGSDTTSFKMGINNMGNQDQRFKLSFESKNPSFIVQHPDGRPLKPEEKLVSVKSQASIEIPLKVKITAYKRNFRRFDIDTHIPNRYAETSTNTVFIHAVQTTNFIGKPAASMSKVKFVKLPNIRKINETGYAGIPLTIQGDIYGIFSQSVSMNLFMYGQTDLGPDRFITYSYQLPVSSYTFNNFIFENGSPNIGYFFPKGNIQVGNVSGGVGGGGHGVKATYKLTEKRSLTAFVATNPYFFHNIGQISTGLMHQATTDGVVTGYANSYTFIKDLNTGTRVDFFTNSISLKLFEKHTFSFNNAIGNTNHLENGLYRNRLSFSEGGSYASNFYNQKLSLSLSLQSSNNFFGNYYSNTLSNNFSLNFNPDNNWRSTFNYSDVKSTPSYLNPLTGSFDNLPGSRIQNYTLGVTNQKLLGSISPSIFYTRNINPYLSSTSKGLNLYYSTYNAVQNYRFSLSGKGALTTLLDYPRLAPYFTATLTNRIAWRTLAANLFYFYGPFSQGEQDLIINNSTFQPQTFKANVSYSYLFKNDVFALNVSTNFRYSNYLDKYYFGLLPTLYYYTTNGWRFYFGLQYFINSGIREKNAALNNSPLLTPKTDEDLPIVTKSISANAGFKKDIVIPVFGKKAFNVEFEAFLDENGNGKRDVNEDPVKDIIVRFNEHEVQTNDKGTALLINLPMGKYKATAVSLFELDGWFQKPQDTIMVIKDQKYPIPFVRGIRIYGNLILDKEKYSTIDEDFFDISKIRISVFDSLGKEYNSLTGFDGSFMIYVPIGKYTLSMNEEVLGQRFRLVQNNIPLFLNKDLENIYVSLYIIEKRRKVNIKKFGGNNAGVPQSTNSSDSSVAPKSAPIREEYRDTLRKKGQQGTNVTSPEGNANIDPAVQAPAATTVADKVPENPNFNPQSKDVPIAPGSNQVKYYVQQGNKLEDIAKAYGMTIDEIKKENNLTSNAILPGQLLKVNKIAPTASVTYPLTSTTVLPGEDFYKLYKRVGMTAEEIIRVNNLKSDKVKPGQVLRVKKY